MLIKIWVLQEEQVGADWTFENHYQILGETAAILIGFLCYSTIFCPSVIFMLLVYAPSYIVIHLA